MSARTFNDLVASVMGEAEEAEASLPDAVEATPVPAPAKTEAATGEVEKLASVLEFLGRRGVENLLKTATAADAPPPGTNAGAMHKGNPAKTVPHNASSPPMGGFKAGPVETNASQRPGGGGSVDTKGTGHATHHPALASNEGPKNADKKVKAQSVAPALERVLDAKPFADNGAKTNLTGAAAKGDKNIKTAHDLDAIRAELARRVAASTGDTEVGNGA